MSDDILGIEYDINVTKGGHGIIADYYVGGSGVHISGGVLALDIDFTAAANTDALNNITIGGFTFPVLSLFGIESGMGVKGELKNSAAPYLGMGYSQTISSHWTIGAELGAVMTGGLVFSAQGFGAVLQPFVDRELAGAQDEFADIAGHPLDFLPMGIVYAGYRF